MSDIATGFLAFGLLSIMGFVMIGVALYVKRYQRKKEENERELVSGTIVDAVEKINKAPRSRSVRFYVPVIEFTANGQVYRLENENGVREKDKIIVGKSVDVMYDAFDPTHFHITSDDANETGASSLMRYGVIWLIGDAALVIADSYLRLLFFK